MVKLETDKCDVTELPFNSDQYNYSTPTLSIDDKTLYLASDTRYIWTI
jgi:hypothetical protein